MGQTQQQLIRAQRFFFSLSQYFDPSLYQVWGISETRDQNYGSNARPRLRLADLLTEVVILQLFAVLSDRNSIIGLSFWPILDRSFSDAFGPRGEKLIGKQTKFLGKNHQIEPSSDRNP